MCVVERKTYAHADGRRETFETTRRCPRARDSRPCDRVEHRSSEEARIVERRPNTERAEGDDFLVTEGRNGRERLYRDITRRSSKRTSTTIRRSNTTSKRPSMESPPSTPSPSGYSSVEVRPSAPSPPPAVPAFPVLERERRPRYGTNEPSRTVAPDGTVFYDRPPLLDLPRATENERHARFAQPEPERRSSFASTTTEVNEPIVLGPPRRRPSIRIRTSDRPPVNTSPSASSPGLSQLPNLSHLRNDSARDIPKYRPQDPRRESSRRQQQAEDDRQAQIERDRLAESDRRQQDRRQQARRNAETATRDASRERKERHRRETADALEGIRARTSLREEQLEGELAQMARERAAASDARNRESDQSERYLQDRLRRDAEAREQCYETRGSTSPRVSRRAIIGERGGYAPYNSSPLSARSPTYGGVMLHQSQYLSTRRESSFSAQGADVVAREQARASAWNRPQRATRRLSEALGDLDIQDEEYDRDAVDGEYELDEYYVNEGVQRRESRREERDAARAQQRRQFWARDDKYQ
ncbi:hypothetical protein LTR85_012189 [Meristemomyces frigidus]|nr:hypothetical protein LTR85_012189 [Meristemomyces frigidus]